MEKEGKKWTTTLIQVFAQAEFLGTEPKAPHSISAVVMIGDACQTGYRNLRRLKELPLCLERDFEISRSGPEHWDFNEEKQRLDRLKWAADILNRVAERCKELGIGCILENKLPHLLFARTSDILWILSTMDSVDVGVCLDTGHANLTGDIYSVMHKLGPHSRMIHAHDNHGTGDQHLAPGNGNIDWNRLLTELDRTGFRGRFILELASMGDIQHLLTEARNGKRLLRAIGRRLALAPAKR